MNGLINQVAFVTLRFSLYTELTTKRIEGGGPCARPNHRTEVATAEQRVLGPTDTRRVHSGLFVAERTPLGAHVDDAVADHQATLAADHVARPVVLDERGVRMRIAHDLVRDVAPARRDETAPEREWERV